MCITSTKSENSITKQESIVNHSNRRVQFTYLTKSTKKCAFSYPLITWPMIRSKPTPFFTDANTVGPATPPPPPRPS